MWKEMIQYVKFVKKNWQMALFIRHNLDIAGLDT